MNVRSFSSRAIPFVFALVLLLLQSAAPLLHAHAADDPRELTSSGFHLPGLEPVPVVTGARDVISDRFYPLIEETECCAQRVTSAALTAPAVAAPPSDAGAHARRPLHPARWHAAGDCAPPPPRAPPLAFPARAFPA